MPADRPNPCTFNPTEGRTVTHQTHPDNAFVVRSRWFEKDKGWQEHDEPVEGNTFQAAGAAASARARELDAIYGDSHFWTVDVHNLNHDEFGSYYQLFHGRLS